MAPWAAERARLKKLKVQPRAQRLGEEREPKAADPVWGKPTPFNEALDRIPKPLSSIDTLIQEKHVPGKTRMEMMAGVTPGEDLGRLNHALSPGEVHVFIQNSRLITQPPERDEHGVHLGVPPEDRAKWEMKHIQAMAAIHRIVSLGNESSKDKTRANKQLCIETFGRHNTDKLFPQPRYPSNATHPEQALKKTPRVGADTGSSEVQAGILTAKIRVLAKHMETNKKDKMNRRNLRMMCHRRQKLLKYLKRKERGGERYRSVMTALGLDDAAIERELAM